MSSPGNHLSGRWGQHGQPWRKGRGRGQASGTERARFYRHGSPGCQENSVSANAVGVPVLSAPEGASSDNHRPKNNRGGGDLRQGSAVRRERSLMTRSVIDGSLLQIFYRSRGFGAFQRATQHFFACIAGVAITLLRASLAKTLPALVRGQRRSSRRVGGSALASISYSRGRNCLGPE